MADEPSGFLAHAEHAADLERRHALLGRHQQVRGVQPLVQRDLAALIKRADRHRERLAAGVALMQAGTMRFAL